MTPSATPENYTTLTDVTRAKEAGHPEDWPQVSWAIAEVIFDKHGEPFDAEAIIRQGIINYHKSCE